MTNGYLSSQSIHKQGPLNSQPLQSDSEDEPKKEFTHTIRRRSLIRTKRWFDNVTDGGISSSGKLNNVKSHQQ